jgi:diamine N-acetyltransferase
MLKMRPFVKGADELVWVEVLNASRRGREDWRAVTAEEMILQEKEDPSFDSEGRFIAELDGEPVAVVHAHVDKLREESKGFILVDVLPESRGSGIERQLVKTALRELRARGMSIAQASAEARQRDYIEVLEGLGFSRVRVANLMEMDLDKASENMGENREVTIASLRRDREEDTKLLTSIINETFKDLFDFRPETVEETRHFLFSDPCLSDKEVFFAVLEGEAVGYIGVGIDDKYNLEKNVKAGEIFGIGVLERLRRKGIGVRLMLHGLETLRAKGMTRAMLGVDDQNPSRANRLYEKVGFRVKKKELFLERQL